MTIPRLTRHELQQVRIVFEALEVEDRIERNGQNHAPGEDRYEGPNHNERPIDQERQKREPDRKLDFVLSREKLSNGSQAAPPCLPTARILRSALNRLDSNQFPQLHNASVVEAVAHRVARFLLSDDCRVSVAMALLSSQATEIGLRPQLLGTKAPVIAFMVDSPKLLA